MVVSNASSPELVRQRSGPPEGFGKCEGYISFGLLIIDKDLNWIKVSFFTIDC